MARDGPRARRHRGARRRDPHAPARLGGERARRRLHRSAGRLPELQEPLPRRRPADQGHARARRRAVPGVRHEGHAHRAAACSTSCSRRSWGRSRSSAAVVYLRPETAQGIYVNFLNVQQIDAAEGAVRHRADRQGVPQRDHARATSSSARASSSRWRCSSSSSRAPTWSGSSTGRSSACSGTSRSASTPTRLQFHQHTTEELAHYARAAFDIQFDFGGTLGFQEIEGVHNRGDFDLGAAPGVLRQEARVLRPAEQQALPAVRRRDVGRRRPHDARACS